MAVSGYNTFAAGLKSAVNHPISQIIGDVCNFISSDGFKFFIGPAKLTAAIWKYTNPAAWAERSQQPMGVVPALLGIAFVDEVIVAAKIFTSFSKLVKPIVTEIAAATDRSDLWTFDIDTATEKGEVWALHLNATASRERAKEVAYHPSEKEAFVERCVAIATLVEAVFDSLRLINRFLPFQGLLGRSLPYVKPVTRGFANVKGLYQDLIFFKESCSKDPWVEANGIGQGFLLLSIVRGVISFVRMIFEVPSIYLGESQPRRFPQILFYLTVLEGTLSLVLKAAEYGGYCPRKEWLPKVETKNETDTSSTEDTTN